MNLSIMLFTRNSKKKLNKLSNGNDVRAKHFQKCDIKSTENCASNKG